MRQRFIPLYLFISLLFFYSCTEDTDTVGTTLTDVEKMFNDTSYVFPVTSSSVKSFNVYSRSRNGYLGMMKDLETECYLTCNYMTQLRTMGKYQFPGIDTIYINPDKYDPTIEKYKQIEADSCCLELFILSAVGDSLTPMKVSVHDMIKPYEEGITYYTDFDPELEGMVRAGFGAVNSCMTYTTSNHVYSDVQRASSSYANHISIGLNDPYVDKDDPTTTYKNYGTYLMRKFYNPASSGDFLNQYKFTHNICPGFYIKHEGGVGNIATIYVARLIVYFTSSITKKGMSSAFAGTEEVVQKSSLKQSDTKLQQLIDKTDCSYIKSPAGIWTEMELPVESIMKGHESDTLNTARMFIPRINNNAQSDYAFQVPKTLLMVPTDSVSYFFETKQVANYRNTYLASYGSKTNGYTFENLSILISNMYKNKLAGKASDKWNKVTLIPVEATYSTVSSSSAVLTKVTHDMSMSSTKLQNKDLKISVIYSRK